MGKTLRQIWLASLSEAFTDEDEVINVTVDSEWLSSRTSFQLEDEVLDTSEP